MGKGEKMNTTYKYELNVGSELVMSYMSLWTLEVLEE